MHECSKTKHGYRERDRKNNEGNPMLRCCSEAENRRRENHAEPERGEPGLKRL